MEKYINSKEDLYEMLDQFVYKIEWDEFYQSRSKPAPFLKQSSLPDENLVRFIEDELSIKDVLELGCGEGRNAIYMAKKEKKVTAIDFSGVSIANAKERAQKEAVEIDFVKGNIFSYNYGGKVYDFIYDSGLFHHLAPHRRLQYIEMINQLLKPGGYFGLVCFAWGENCADEVDDWHFYEQKHSGVAFRKERLQEFFAPYFNTIEIRKYKSGVPDTMQGVDFLWTCLFQKK